MTTLKRSKSLTAILALVVATTAISQALPEDYETQTAGDPIVVSGTISENTVWSSANVYILGGSVTVSAGSTLTIEAGTVIKGNGVGSKLVVEGMLNAAGTEAEPIYFTSLKDDAVGGDTNGDSDESSPESKDWIGVGFDHLDSLARIPFAARCTDGAGEENTSCVAAAPGRPKSKPCSNRKTKTWLKTGSVPNSKSTPGQAANLRTLSQNPCQFLNCLNGFVHVEHSVAVGTDDSEIIHSGPSGWPGFRERPPVMALRKVAPDLAVSLKKVEGACLTGKPSRLPQDKVLLSLNDPRVSLPDHMQALQ